LSLALVYNNPNAAGKRCGFPDEDAQQQDSKSLFIPHLHHESEEQGKEITSFFVRRSVYLAFFGKSVDLGLDSSPDLSQSPPRHAQRTRLSVSQGSEMDGIERSRRQSLEREELDRAEAERQEQERREQERLEQERVERERQERLEREMQDRLEQERLELRRLEERLEREDLQERLAEALQVEERLEQENQNQRKHEKREQERQEEERRRQETREEGRREQEKALKDLERTRKRHTQIDIESLVSSTATGNQDGLSAAGHAQETSGRQVIYRQAFHP